MSDNLWMQVERTAQGRRILAIKGIYLIVDVIAPDDL